MSKFWNSDIFLSRKCLDSQCQHGTAKGRWTCNFCTRIMPWRENRSVAAALIKYGGRFEIHRRCGKRSGRRVAPDRPYKMALTMQCWLTPQWRTPLQPQKVLETVRFFAPLQSRDLIRLEFLARNQNDDFIITRFLKPHTLDGNFVVPFQI